MAKKKLTPADGAPETAPAAVAERPGEYVVNFRQVDSGGKPRPHAWLPPTVTIAGCTSADDARAKLHELFDKAVFQIERSR